MPGEFEFIERMKSRYGLSSVGDDCAVLPAVRGCQLITDTGGLNDRGFNHLAFVGLKKAEAQLGALSARWARRCCGGSITTVSGCRSRRRR